MITTIEEIIRQIQRPGASFSQARMELGLGSISINGTVITEFGEVEINQGDVFRVRHHQWTFDGQKWVKNTA